MCYQLLRGSVEGHEEEEIVHGGQESTVQARLSTRARITTAMISKFKQNGNKLEGKLGDSLYDAMAAHLELSNDLGLRRDQKTDYLHHLFWAESKSKRFYRAYVVGNQGTFAEACAAMESEFNSLTRQNRCRTLRMKITLPHAMMTEKLTTTEAPEFISNKMTNLAGQAPEQYREEIYRQEYMYNA